MLEYFIAWLPVVVSTACTTAIGIILKKLMNKFASKISGDTQDIRRSAKESEEKAISALNEAKELNNNTKELLALVKDEREANKAILAEMRKTSVEMVSIRNEMRTIKTQNAREIRGR